MTTTVNLSHEDRYNRQKLITWWDQERLLKSKVLVVGAGALGNEIVKNLALVGVGDITIVDMDIIEHTNLARCVFFKAGDEGKFKSTCLAEAAAILNPDIKTSSFTGPVQSLGDAYLTRFDLVIAGLDNREARLWLSAALRRIGKKWIDGAIEGLMGKVQTFTPDGACYGCSMSEKDWDLLSKRKSCALLGKEEMLQGHTPTNASTSSIVAGIQVQEAIKYLVGRDDLGALENKVWRFIGDQMTTFTSQIEIDEFCIFHYETIASEEIVYLPGDLSSLLDALNLKYGEKISFFENFFVIQGCVECKTESIAGFEYLLKGEGSCKLCKAERRVTTGNQINRDSFSGQININKSNWPLETYLEVVGTDARRVVRVRGNENE